MTQPIQKQKPEKTGCTHRLQTERLGMFTWREEDPSTGKILESETNFRLVYMQKIFVGVVAGNQIKLSAECRAATMFFFSVPCTGIIGAKVVYMVLGS